MDIGLSSETLDFQLNWKDSAVLFLRTRERKDLGWEDRKEIVSLALELVNVRCL